MISRNVFILKFSFLKMTTVIAVGDPHFRTDNIPEVEMFIERLESLCLKHMPDLIVILGDVLHTHERLHTTPMNKAEELIHRMRKIAPTIVLVGNHDMISNQEFLTENHWMNAMKLWDNVTVVDRVISRQINGLKFFFCPYVYAGRFQEALNTCKEDWTKADCIFAHQEFYGCKMAAIVSAEGDVWPDTYPLVVSGHIHGNQTLKNIYYCGSSMQHAFGESERNIIPILTWKKGGKKYSLEEVDLDLPRKRIVYKDVSDMENFTLPETEDHLKITLSGDQEEFKAFKKTKKYKELVKTGTKVVFKPKKQRENTESKHTERLGDDPTGDDPIDFHVILDTLISAEKNPDLFELYMMVVHGKEIKSEDILFV